VNLVDIEPRAAEAMREKLDSHLSAAPLEDVKDEGVRIDPAIAERPPRDGLPAIGLDPPQPEWKSSSLIS
jgi:hypothetical protein